MRLEKLTAYEKRPVMVDGQVKKDRLKNTVYELVESAKGYGSFANWSVAEIALMDRSATKTSRKVIAKMDFKKAHEAEAIQLGDRPKMTVKEVKEAGRWVVFVVERWRT